MPSRQASATACWPACDARLAERSRHRSDGKLVHGGKKEDVGDLKGVRHLLSTVYDWLVVDRNDRKEREKLEKANPKPKSSLESRFGSRHMAYYR